MMAETLHGHIKLSKYNLIAANIEVLMVEAITFNLLFYGQFFKRLGSAAG
jgi:hypothetical protein